MTGERIKTFSSASRDNWFSYRSPLSPFHPYPSLDTVSPTRRPGYLVWISTSLSTPPRTFRFAFLSICSFNLAYPLRSAPGSASRGSQLEIIRPIFLCERDVFLGLLAIRADDRCVLQRKSFTKLASVKLQNARDFN